MKVDIVFCDDIRFEVTGKHTLVGTYCSDLRISEAPATVPIWCWLRLSGAKVGNHTFELTIKSPDGKIANGANGSLEIIDSKFSVPLPVGPFPINIMGEGQIEASFAIDGKPIATGILPVGIGAPPPEMMRS